MSADPIGYVARPRYIVGSKNATSDMGIEIPAGNVDGVLSVNKFGRNTDIDTTLEDVWDGGGVYSWPSSAAITHVRAAVNSAATRGGTIEVQGLDTNWDLVVQNATLDAADSTTEVALGTPLRRCFRMKNISATSFDENVQAGPTGFATIYAQITAGFDQTLMALYTIPNGYQGYLTNWWGNINKANASGALDLNLWARSEGGVFRIQNTIGVQAAGSSAFQHHYQPYPAYSAKTDLRVSGTGSTNNFDVSAGFDLILVET